MNLLPAKASFVDSQLSLCPLDDSALRSYASATLRRDYALVNSRRSHMDREVWCLQPLHSPILWWSHRARPAMLQHAYLGTSVAIHLLHLSLALFPRGTPYSTDFTTTTPIHYRNRRSHEICVHLGGQTKLLAIYKLQVYSLRLG